MRSGYNLTVDDVINSNPSVPHTMAKVWKNWADSTLDHANYINSNVEHHISGPYWKGVPALKAQQNVSALRQRLTTSAGAMHKIEAALSKAGRAFSAAKTTLAALKKQAEDSFLVVNDDGSCSTDKKAGKLTTQEKAKQTQALNELPSKLKAALHKARQADSDLSRELASLIPANDGGNRNGGTPYHGGGTPYNGGGSPTSSGHAGPPASGDTSAHSGSAKENQQIAKELCAKYGWDSGSNWESLIKLWNQESGWNANAVNPSSGAYGIPQALGHGHPFSLGDAKAQIEWGLNYIKQRYGSPSAAWAHEVSNNWY